VLVQLGEVPVLQVLLQLALAELVLASRLGDVGQVGELRRVVAQPLRDEDLSGSVGEVLLGADHVRDAHCVIVHDAGQVVQTRPVRALDRMILLARPLHLHLPADPVGEATDPVARHLQPNDAGTSLRLETASILRGRGHPLPAVDETTLLRLRDLALAAHLLGRGVVPIGQTGLE